MSEPLGAALVYLSQSRAAQRLAAAWPSLDVVEADPAIGAPELRAALLDEWARAANVSRHEARRWAGTLIQSGICTREGLHADASRFLAGVAMVEVLGRARPVLPKRTSAGKVPVPEPGKQYEM